MNEDIPLTDMLKSMGFKLEKDTSSKDDYFEIKNEQNKICLCLEKPEHSELIFLYRSVLKIDNVDENDRLIVAANLLQLNADVDMLRGSWLCSNQYLTEFKLVTTIPVLLVNENIFSNAIYNFINLADEIEKLLLTADILNQKANTQTGFPNMANINKANTHVNLTTLL